MATVTHRVFMTDVSCSLNLRYIAMNTRDVVYTKVPFHVLRWKHKKIGGMCMVYASGKIIHQVCETFTKIGFPHTFAENKSCDTIGHIYVTECEL